MICIQFTEVYPETTERKHVLVSFPCHFILCILEQIHFLKVFSVLLVFKSDLCLTSEC